ncbi:hypothetical protein FA13DRAFT_493557 [Coprinellus micaceus]|uniref:Uncharacterized protein n=1 Tax=Coprinellus micaceus TaxID=71717 RepID=A0A4Y7T9V9_COPMI|nr:hypothetical protein FA13DRAFT_493557 [Coprinellus micaceus]
MNAALRTPEILDLIFQHLRFTEDLTVPDARLSAPFLVRWQRKRSTLLNAGLACKAFFEPAMASLWWRVNGIMPFIRLLPNISSKMSQNAYDYMMGREWTLEEELDESGLERFDFYAKLVTHIVDLGRKGDDNLSVLLIQLAEIRPSSRCFPRLKSLKACHFNPDPWLFYTAPTLQELFILAQNYTEDTRLKTSLSTLIGRLPARSADLRVMQVPFIPHERSLKSLLQLQDLRQLTIKSAIAGSPPVSEVLAELSTLPRLEQLDLSYPPGIPPLVAPLEFPSEWYPQLTSLAVTGSPQSIQSVLLYLASRPLEEVTMRLSWPEPRDPPEASSDVAALTLTVQTLAESLKSVNISYEALSPIYPMVATLAPSLSVPTLADVFLPSIPQSWPKLKTLSLPQTMIHGLPDLRDLSLEFAAGDTPLPDIVAPQLRVLDVRSSPICNKRRAALNLAKTFPNLERLGYNSVAETHIAGARRYSDAWREVKTWLPVLTGRYSGEEDDEADSVVIMRGPRTVGQIAMAGQSHPIIAYDDEDDMDEEYEFDEDSDDPLGYGGDDL